MDATQDEYITHLTNKIEELIDRRVFFKLTSGIISSEGLFLFDRISGS